MKNELHLISVTDTGVSLDGTPISATRCEIDVLPSATERGGILATVRLTLLAYVRVEDLPSKVEISHD